MAAATPATAAAPATTTPPVAETSCTVKLWNGWVGVVECLDSQVGKCLTLNDSDSTLYKVMVIAANILTGLVILPLLIAAYAKIANCFAGKAVTPAATPASGATDDAATKAAEAAAAAAAATLAASSATGGAAGSTTTP